MGTGNVERDDLILASLKGLILIVMFIAVRPAWAVDPQRYDASEGPYKFQIIDDITLTDETRRREIPLRIYYPDAPDLKSPVILVSHGIGGSKTTGNWVGQFMATDGAVRSSILICLKSRKSPRSPSGMRI